MGQPSKTHARRMAQETRRARAAWLLACDLAAQACGADVRQVVRGRGVVGRGSDRVTTRARKVACYLAQIVADVPAGLLSDASGFDRRTIFKHSEWVEEERERVPGFDREIEGLEQDLFKMAARVVLGRLGIASPEGVA